VYGHICIRAVIFVHRVLHRHEIQNLQFCFLNYASFGNGHDAKMLPPCSSVLYGQSFTDCCVSALFFYLAAHHSNIVTGTC